MIEEIDYICDNELLSTEYVNKEKIINPFCHFIVYTINSKVVGYLYFSLIYDRIEINQFEVLKMYRKRGIGSCLLSYLIESYKFPITLEVRCDNLSAIKLYRKFGFRDVALRKNYYDGVDGILMEKKDDVYE